MDQRSLLAIIIAMLGVLAISLAAAAISAPVGPEVGTGTGGEGDGDALISPPEQLEEPPEVVEIFPNWVSPLLTALAIVATIFLILYLIRYWKESIPVLVVAILAVIGLWFFLGSLSPTFDPPSMPTEPISSELAGGDNGDGDPPNGAIETPLVLIVLFGLALLGVVFAIFSQEVRSTPNTSDVEDETTVSEKMRHLAGRTVARLENANDTDVIAPENEIYRAWQDMTALLDVPDPETTTPKQFQAAAIDAGLDPNPVAELTHLFKEVRYGQYEPTTDRTKRAIAAFEQIADNTPQTPTKTEDQEGPR